MEENQPRKLTIKRIREQGAEIRAFDMTLESDSRPVSFRPGQVAILKAGNEPPGYFAFASAPEDDEIEFLIKRGNGASGVIHDMQPGDQVELVDIVGHGFALDDQKGKDLVFVAMGTGVAPLRSALRQVFKHRSDYGHLVVLYGARTPAHFCYTDETAAWEAESVELREVVSRPDGHDWSGPTGYVQSLLDHIVPELKSPVALVCGSPEMIEQTRDRLLQMGFTPEAILTNY
jgi:NAD(P)H-flavin reductase